MARSRVATVCVLDVGKSVSESPSGETCFFENSRQCLRRMIERKIFAEDNDEISLVTIGSYETNNQLSRGYEYQNIEVIYPLKLATWDLLESLEKLEPSDIESNWIEGIIVALDILNRESKTKKFQNRQIVLFTNFGSEVEFSESNFDKLVRVFCEEKVMFTCIGLNLLEEYEEKAETTQNISLVLKLLDKVETGVSITFQEALETLKYYCEKRKTPRNVHITLDIGNKIRIPVCWSKVVSDDQNLKRWKEVTMANPEAGLQVKRDDEERSYEPSLITDTSKYVVFARTLIPLSYADLEAIKRESGPPEFTLIGCTKRERINPLMFIGKDVYIIRPDPKNKNSQAMLSAFVTALKKADKVGIAKRILMRNGIVNIGALLPVTDEVGSHLYFLKLPLAEWCMSSKTVSQKEIICKEGSETLKAVDDFIDTMLLPPDLLESGQGMLMRDPFFQLSCHILKERSLNQLPPSKEETTIPDFIQSIFDPRPESKKESAQALAKLNELIPADKMEEKKIFKRKKPYDGKNPTNVNVKDNTRHDISLVGLKDVHDDTLSSEVSVDSGIDVLRTKKMKLDDEIDQFMLARHSQDKYSQPKEATMDLLNEM